MAKKRLDIYIHETFELDSRQLAQNYIIQGFVKVNGKEERKPGYYVKPDDQITAEIPKKQFVSRGGIKLAHALDEFNIKPKIQAVQRFAVPSFLSLNGGSCKFCIQSI